MFSPSNGEEIEHAYISKHNSVRETTTILSMITEGKNCHYFAVRKSPRMLQLAATFNNCLHSFRTESKLKSNEREWKDHDYSQVEMSEEHSKIHKYNENQKSMMISFVIYADMESF